MEFTTHNDHTSNSNAFVFVAHFFELNMSPDDPTTQEACHARFLEGVAKSQFPLKAVVFKRQSLVQTRLKKLQPHLQSRVVGRAPCAEDIRFRVFDFSRIAGNCVLSVREWPIHGS